MFAEDPLSLVFLGCIIFSGGFLLASSVLGLGHSHVGHAGHAGHVGHVGDIAHGGDLGHVGHVGHASDIGHAGHGGDIAHVGHGGDIGHAAHAAHAAHGTTDASGHAINQSEAAPTSGGAFQTSVASLLMGALSVYGALLFLLVFGLVGYLVHGVGHAPGPVAIGVAFFIGVVAAAAIGQLLERLFASSPESELAEDSSRYDGRLATVSATIHPGALGEITLVRPNGARASLSARGDEAITLPPGTEVVITGYQQGIATVQSWESVLASAQQTREPSSGSPPGEAR